MKYNATDILNPMYVCAIGRRKDAFTDNQWEVYASLSNGGEFVFGTSGTEEEAAALQSAAKGECELGGEFFIMTRERVYVNIFCIVQLYVDGEGSHLAAFAQDEAGKSYLLRYGTEEECKDHIDNLSAEIKSLERGHR